MTPAEVRTIRDAVGGDKAMAELLEITERAMRQFCRNWVNRGSTVGRIRLMAESERSKP